MNIKKKKDAKKRVINKNRSQEQRQNQNQKLKSKLNLEFYVITILYLISLIYFLYIRSSSMQWDFMSYFLNAKYLFADGFYFEGFRPPLPSFIIGLFGVFFGWFLAMFLYNFFVASLFLFANLKLAKSLKFNKVLFYSLNLNLYALIVGLSQGSELLFSSLIMLSIAYILEDDVKSGVFLGLSTLARYTSLIFFPILFLQKSFKKIILSLFLFGLMHLPWFIFNWFKYGNFFTSFADLYANNILYRTYIHQKVEFSHFLEVQGFLMFFSILGLVFVFYKLFREFLSLAKNEDFKIGKFKLRVVKFWNYVLKNRAEIIMIILIFFSIKGYVITPIKDSRHLFLLLIPTVYFSYICLDFVFKFIEKKFNVFNNFKFLNRNNLFVLIGIAFFLFNIFNLIIYEKNYNYSGYEFSEFEELKDVVYEKNISNCQFMSNAWVFLNYYNIVSYPAPREKVLEKRLDEGYLVVLYNNIGEPEYANNLTKLEQNFTNIVIYKTDNLIILGNKSKCFEPEKVDKLYTQEVSDFVYEAYGHKENIEPCYLIFQDNKLLRNFCEIINLKNISD